MQIYLFKYVNPFSIREIIPQMRLAEKKQPTDSFRNCMADNRIAVRVQL